MNAPHKTIDDDLDEGREITLDPGAISTIVKGEIDIQIATARRYPRSVAEFRRESTQLVTLDVAIAESCNYILQRKQWDPDKREQVTVNIEGPSARFAEVVASCWGNNRWGSRLVGEDRGFIIVQGFFFDLEKNSAGAIEVQRSILTRKGDRFSQDMVGVTANAAASIAVRNAVLKGVPRAFWNDIYLRARTTARGDFKTLNNRRMEAINEAKTFGISPQQVYARLEIAGLDDIGLDHLMLLRGLLNSIRDGDGSPENVFPSEADAAEALKPKATMPKARSEGAHNAAAGHAPVQPSAAATPSAPPPAAAPDERVPAHGPTVATPEGDRGPNAPPRRIEEPSFERVLAQAPADVGEVSASDMPGNSPLDEAPLFDRDGSAVVRPPVPEAHRPGVFKATEGETKSLVTRARARRIDLTELLSRLPETELPGVRIEGEGEDARIIGLSKEGFKLLRAELS